MTKKPLAISLILILLLWIAPLVLALGAGALASALGCTLNENAAQPCMLFGSNIGGTLYAFGVLGWLTIIGIPFVGIALIVWVIVGLILSRRRAS